MIRIGSLFSGIGGLDWGLESAFAEAGLAPRVLWQVEQAEFPRRVLAKHWPHADRSITDVRAATLSVLAPVDVICGGFPCQDLSYAGKGAGLEGERSGLWSEYIRIIRELRPRIVVVENVSALLARGFGVVLGDLAQAGYDASWRCIRASDLGAPHRRERLFIVAYPSGVQSERRGEFGNVGGSSAGTQGKAQERQRMRDASVDGGEAIWGFGGRSQSGMGRATDGLPSRLVLSSRWPAGPGQVQGEWEAARTVKVDKGRSAALKAYGNAVLPHCGREVGRWIVREGWLS